MKSLNFLIATGSLLAGLTLPAAAVDWSQLPPASTRTNVTFAVDIQPLFKASCVRCHNEKRAKKDLKLDSLAGVLAGSEDGPVLTAGDSANSLLVKAISQLDPKTAMPPKHRPHGGPGGPGGPGGGPAPITTLPNGQPAALPPNGGPGKFGPPAKPLTAEQVGLVRAWIDQGAK